MMSHLSLEQRMARYLDERSVAMKYALEARWFPVPGTKVRALGSPYAADAMVIPYLHPFTREEHETLKARFRYLSYKLPVDKNGDEVRFAQPRKSGVEAYFDPHVDWKKVAKDVKIPINFVEGEVKALAMNQIGFVTIGLGGVDNFGGQDLTAWLREVLK